jgi:hypothetical protein
MKVTISRKAHFNAAHRLTEGLDMGTNDAILGSVIIPFSWS